MKNTDEVWYGCQLAIESAGARRSAELHSSAMVGELDFEPPTAATEPPARVILDYAGDNEIDLVVMGTHGHSGFDRHFLGSVTENVVRNAELPVFCVPMCDN